MPMLLCKRCRCNVLRKRLLALAACELAAAGWCWLVLATWFAVDADVISSEDACRRRAAIDCVTRLARLRSLR